VVKKKNGLDAIFRNTLLSHVPQQPLQICKILVVQASNNA
jgi:hypothetical protein